MPSPKCESSLLSKKRKLPILSATMSQEYLEREHVIRVDKMLSVANTRQSLHFGLLANYNKDQFGALTILSLESGWPVLVPLPPRNKNILVGGAKLVVTKRKKGLLDQINREAPSLTVTVSKQASKHARTAVQLYLSDDRVVGGGNLVVDPVVHVQKLRGLYTDLLLLRGIVDTQGATQFPDNRRGREGCVCVNDL